MKFLIVCVVVILFFAFGAEMLWSSEPSFAADGGVFFRQELVNPAYNDLVLMNSGLVEVSVNRHRKRVTITRYGADAGWTCGEEAP